MIFILLLKKDKYTHYILTGKTELYWLASNLLLNQMSSLHLISFRSNLPLLHLLPLTKTPSAFSQRLTFSSFPSSSSSSSSSFSNIVRATNNQEPQKYEVDTDKAREALQQLDQQLQSLSQKQINPPKIRGIVVFLSLLSIINSMCLDSECNQFILLYLVLQKI